MKRRGFVTALGGVVLTGCTGSSPNSGEENETNETNETNESFSSEYEEEEPQTITETLRMTVVDRNDIPQEGVTVLGMDHITAQDVLFEAPPTDENGKTSIEVESGKPYYLNPVRGERDFYFSIVKSDPESAKIEFDNLDYVHQIRATGETSAVIELRGSPY